MWVFLDGKLFTRHATRSSELSGAEGASDSAGGVTAPVPGKIVSVAVAPGDEVTRGQRLFVLESMKMEFEIVAPRDGRIAALPISVGGHVEAGQTLVTWDES